MSDGSFADTLNKFIGMSGYSYGQLAHLSGIPKQTIANWATGIVKKPRRWQRVAMLANALKLTESEATQLLQSSGHPSIEEILARSPSDEDLKVISRWTEEVRWRLGAPFQAIRDLPYFVGRESELKDIENALLAGRHAMLYSFEGMGGVGKTVLAAHLAYKLRSQFPDGVLWANVSTREPLEILSAFAFAYGRDVSNYTDLNSRSQVVRGILADKRALIVLDNVEHSHQIEPLLPPTGTCAVITTSRRRDLSISRHAVRFSINPFSEEANEALSLFAKILGEQKTAKEASTLLEIAGLLGHLPLALDIAASRLAYESGWTIARFLSRLQSEKDRLDALHYEDANIRVTFNISYAALGSDLQDFFAALSVFGTSSFSVEAVAYLTETEIDITRDRLRQLYSLSLIQESHEQRYQLHPLLCDYAREHLDNKMVVERFVDYFVHHAFSNQKTYPTLELDSENILSSLAIAYKSNWLGRLVKGVNAFYHFMEIRGLYGVALDWLNRAQQAAKELGDEPGLITTTLNLGRLAQKQGKYDQATLHFNKALNLAREINDRALISSVLLNVGFVAQKRGEDANAKALLEEGLDWARAAGDAYLISNTLLRLGILVGDNGLYEQEEAHYQEGIIIARQLQDLDLISHFLVNLGVHSENIGDYDRAIAYYSEGLAIAEKLGHRERTAHILSNLGVVFENLGQYDKAESYYKRGLSVVRAIGHQELIAHLLQNVGELAEARGHYEEARSSYLEAFSLATELGHRKLIAHLYLHLGTVAYNQGNVEDADRYLHDGLDLARVLQRPEIICRLLLFLGALAEYKGNHIEAAKYLQDGLTTAKELNRPDLVMHHLLHLGILARAQKQLEESSAYFEEALTLARTLRRDWFIGTILAEQGKLRLQENLLDLAEGGLLESKSIADNLGLNALMANSLFGLAQLAQRRGQLDEARRLGQESVDIFRRIGHFMEAEVTQWLEGLS